MLVTYVINKQNACVDNSDYVFNILHTALGTPTSPTNTDDVQPSRSLHLGNENLFNSLLLF